MKHWISRSFFGPALILILLSLASCLSVEMEVDLRQDGDYQLTMRYTMSRDLWELGVFDEDSPERAVPVSRRDAEETALRYEDVTLSDYEQRTTADDVEITAVYRVGTPDSLQALWGSAGGTPMRFDPEEGVIIIPLSAGTEELDPVQRDMFSSIFDNRHARLTVIPPGEILRTTITGLSPETVGEERESERFTLHVSMYDLVTTGNESALTVYWRDE